MASRSTTGLGFVLFLVATMVASLCQVAAAAPVFSPEVATPAGPTMPTVETVAGGVAPHRDALQVTVAPAALVANAPHLFVADSFDHVIRRVDRVTGMSDVIAGDGADAVDGDGGAATAASIGEIADVAVDPAGTVFLSGGGRVRRVAADGTITTVIGGGTVEPVAGAVALGTSLGSGAIVATGVDQVLVIEPPRSVPTPGWGRVWRVGADGALVHVAGDAHAAVRGDGGPAVAAKLIRPQDLDVDLQGRVLIADEGDRRIRRIAADGTISTFAGGGTATPGTGGPATDAVLGPPSHVVVHGDGVVSIGERDLGDPLGSALVRSVDLGGTITVTAGGGNAFPGSGGPATEARLSDLSGLAALGTGDVAIGGHAAVLRRDPTGALTRTVGSTEGFPDDGQPALDVQLGSLEDERDRDNNTLLAVDPQGVVHGRRFHIEDGVFHDDRNRGWLLGFDASGNRFGWDPDGSFVVRTPEGGEVRRVTLQVANLLALAVSPNGDVYQAFGEHRCFPRQGCSGTAQVVRFENPAVSARPPLPQVGGEYQISGLAVDAAGGVVSVVGDCAVTEFLEPCPQGITHVNADGTNAGQASAPYGSLVTRYPGVDAAGAVYYGSGHRVWKIPLGGVPEVVAGTGVAGYSGDGGPATEAQFGTIRAVTVAPDGSLYVADGPRIRRVTTVAEPPPVPAPNNLTVRDEGGAMVARWLAPVNAAVAGVVGFRVTVTGAGTGADGTFEVPLAQTQFEVNPVARGAEVTISVQARTATATSVAVTTSLTDGSGFHALTPQRILDSRTATGGWSGPLSSAVPRTLTITGQAGVPSTASAVVMNVTATAGTAGSFLTTWPSDVPKPNVSNLNFAAGETIANLVTVKLSATGSVSFANAVGTVHVVADIIGYYNGGNDSPASAFHRAVTPTRLLDSRTATGGWNGKLNVFQPRTLAVRGVGPVPATATAVVANVTATNATKGSFLTVWPTGQLKPNASNLNFGPGQTIANLAVVWIGHDGTISLANAVGATDVVVDVVGYFDPTGGARFYPLTPNRVLDSRLGVGLTGAFGPNDSRALTVEGTPGIPSDIDAVVANVTATEGTANSFASLYPDGQPRQGSNLNFGVGQTIPNLTVTGVSPDGKIRLYNANGSVHLVADAVGYYAAPATAP